MEVEEGVLKDPDVKIEPTFDQTKGYWRKSQNCRSP